MNNIEKLLNSLIGQAQLFLKENLFFSIRLKIWKVRSWRGQLG